MGSIMHSPGGAKFLQRALEVHEPECCAIYEVACKLADLVVVIGPV